MDEIEIIKNQIAKQATIFETRGARPTIAVSESWIGKVYLFKENEEVPLDKHGKQMMPLIQISFTDAVIKPRTTTI